MDHCVHQMPLKTQILLVPEGEGGWTSCKNQVTSPPPPQKKVPSLAVEGENKQNLGGAPL